MQASGIVVADEHTMVGLGDVLTVNALLAIAGLALIAILHHKVCW